MKSVRRVFPDLRAGFYTRLSDNSILASSPSFNYVALLDVSHRDCSSESSAVNEVMLSPEGDTLYSICSDHRSCEVTVLRLSNQEILTPKKSFLVPSLFLLPVKEGVVLSMGNGVPELWNFELTRRIRPLPKLSGYERLSRVSHELIACQGEVTSQYPLFEGTHLPELRVLYSPMDTETPSGVHDSTEISDDAISPNSFDFALMQLCFPLLSLTADRMLEVDIFNVTTQEFIFSKVSHDVAIKFVCCNIRGEFLVSSFMK